MADRKYLERIEHLTGTGQVLEGSREVCTVHYSLDIFQEKIESSTHSGTRIIDGMKQIQGTIKPVDTSIHELFGKALTLVLIGGKKMNFFIDDPRTGFIASSSGIY